MTTVDARRVADMLRRVPRPSKSDGFNIRPLFANAWVGLFGNGAPALFFELPIDEQGTARTLARGVELIASSSFEVVDQGRSGRRKIRSGYAIALREIDMTDVFAAVTADAVSRLTGDPSAFARKEDVERYIAAWIEFFSPLSLSPERIVGLWGELYVLASFSNRERGVVCWVGPYGQMFDFMGNGVCIEVKTSLRSAVASFSLAQIEGRDDGHSIFVRVLKDDRNGRSIDELVAEIRDDLSSSVQFEAALVRAGYRAGANAGLRLTAEQLRAIPNRKIPRPIVKDSRIKSVRYEVDIDGLAGEFVLPEPLLKRMSTLAPNRSTAP